MWGVEYENNSFVASVRRKRDASVRPIAGASRLSRWGAGPVDWRGSASRGASRWCLGLL